MVNSLLGGSLTKLVENCEQNAWLINPKLCGFTPVIVILSISNVMYV